MNEQTIAVRCLSSADAKDWQAVFELCCRTGNNGETIALERWELFGRLWIGPYKKIVPQWTYVAESQQGIIIGYLTGSPDTSSFNKTKFKTFSLPLLADIARWRYSINRDAKTFVRQIFWLEKEPERLFSPRVRLILKRDYPAHLHMNVDARWRNRGVGKKLVEAFFRDLRSVEVPGVHLFCGAGPLEFYRHCGFNELAQANVRGTTVYALGALLPE